MTVMTTCEASKLQLPQPSWGSPCHRGAPLRGISIVQHGQGIVVLKELGAPYDSEPLQRDLPHLAVSDEHVALHLLDILGGKRVAGLRQAWALEHYQSPKTPSGLPRAWDLGPSSPPLRSPVLSGIKTKAPLHLPKSDSRRVKTVGGTLLN